MSNNIEESDLAAQQALHIAFKTMQERCQQLENRLAAVEEENIRLRIGKTTNSQTDIIQISDRNDIETLKEKVAELSKQKSQLTHHVLMVAAENRQLWNRLTRLTRTNKTLGSKLIKISDTLKQNPQTESNVSNNVPSTADSYDKIHVLEFDTKEGSLEEISLRLINSIMLEKSELEQQCSEMMELQNGTNINLKNVGFTYPDENNIDSLQQLKHHELRLSQIKTSLLLQQNKLKNMVQNMKKTQERSKKVCQTGTQIESDDSMKENGATQTSLPLEIQSENLVTKLAVEDSEKQICPMCGSCFDKSVPFPTFHEHVLSHFSTNMPLDIEIVP